MIPTARFSSKKQLRRVSKLCSGLSLLAAIYFVVPDGFAQYCNTSPAYVTKNCTVGGIVSESWSFQNAPTTGLTSITFPFIVFTAPNKSGYFFAQQFSFVNNNNDSGQGAYIGIQPGRNGKENAHFSFFGTGSNAVNTTSCTTGADGGSGTTCQVEVPFVTGHQYNLTVYRDSNSHSIWRGQIIDYTACQVTTGLGVGDTSPVCAPTEIGAWDIGYKTALGSSYGGFVEYFDQVAKGCSDLPYADVEFMAPTTPSKLSSEVDGEYSYGGCNNQVNYSGSQSTHNLWVRSETGW